MLPSPFFTWVEAVDQGFNSAHIITYGNVGENLHSHNFHAHVTTHGEGTRGRTHHLHISERLSAALRRENLVRGVRLLEVGVEEADRQWGIPLYITQQDIQGVIHD